MKVRVTDIARIAGVSTATVDRVLNKRKGVSGRTSERVRQALDRLTELERAGLNGRVGVQAQPKSFDFLIPAGTNFFLDEIAAAVEQKKEEFAMLGVQPSAHRMQGFDPASIAEQILSAAEYSDGIAVVAIDHPVVREAISAAAVRGVPIVTLVSDISSSRRLGYVGVDNLAAGRLAGYLLGRFLSNREGAVALVAGSLTYRGHAERELGFRSVLREDFPHLNIIDAREAKDENDLSFDAAADLLRTNPELIGIYNIGGGTPGVARALSEAGRTDVVFVAHELNPVTRDLLISGVLDAIINQNASQEIVGAIRMLMNHHAGRDIDANMDPVRIEVFFRENLP